MKKILLLALLLTACSDSTATPDIVRGIANVPAEKYGYLEIYYIWDPRGEQCFAVTNPGYPNGMMATVECTPKVIEAIKQDRIPRK